MGSNPFVGIKKYIFIIFIIFFYKTRKAAQIGSASTLGVGGCWFESNLSDIQAADWVSILFIII